MRAMWYLSVLIVLFHRSDAANPIGQVISMLQGMAGKISTISNEMQKEFQEVQVHCAEESQELRDAISVGKDRQADAKADIEKANAEIASAETQISEAVQSLAQLDSDVTKSNKIRSEEKRVFREKEQHSVETAGQLEQAHAIIKSAGVNFLQQSVKDDIFHAIDVLLSDDSVALSTKAGLQEFLQSQDDDSDEDQSKKEDVQGLQDVVANLAETAQNNIRNLRDHEVKNQHNYELTQQAYNNDKKTFEEQKARSQRHLNQMKEELATATNRLTKASDKRGEDEKALQELKNACMSRATEYETETKERGFEMESIKKAIEVLGKGVGEATKREYRDDEGDVSFLQYAQQDPRDRGVLEVLRRAGLVQLATRVHVTLSVGGHTSDVFAKVRGLIDDMLSKLKKEADEDAGHHEFCTKEMKKSDDKVKEMEQKTQLYQTRVDKYEAKITSKKEDIASGQEETKQIAENQKFIDTARSKEKALYEEAKADYEQGIQAVQDAIQTLRDYYAADESKPGAQQNSAEGVLAMLEVAESDFTKSLTELTTTENTEIEVYEKNTQENEVRTAELVQKRKDDIQVRTSSGKTLEEAQADLDSTTEEYKDVLKSRSSLITQCVNKPMTFEERAAKRQKEIEGLETAMGALEKETVQTTFMAVRRHDDGDSDS